MRAAREAPFAVESDPPRLVQQEDGAGGLLTAAQRGFARGLDEPAAWQRFQRGKNAPPRWSLARWWWFAPALGALAVLATHVRAKRVLDRDGIAPEPTTFAAIPLALSASPLEGTRRNPPVSPAMRAAVRSSTLPRGVHPIAIAPVSSTASEAVTDAVCRRFASEGKLEQAVACFEQLGHGTGLGADVALYEAARLSAERLHEPERALELLDQHARQFPDSALRGENAWLRVVSLERAGELEAALRESEQLLASPVGRALSAKIHLLRGRIYRQNRGDCAHAVQEYVPLLGEPGAAGDEAELERARCLESLAQPEAAIAAYERYLLRSDPREPTLARERLQALRAETSEGANP